MAIYYGTCESCGVEFSDEGNWLQPDYPTRCRYCRFVAPVAPATSRIESNNRVLTVGEVRERMLGLPVVVSPYMPRDRALLVDGEIVAHPDSVERLRRDDLDDPVGVELSADLRANAEPFRRAVSHMTSSFESLGSAFGSVGVAAAAAGDALAAFGSRSQGYQFGSYATTSDGTRADSNDEIVNSIEYRYAGHHAQRQAEPEPEVEPVQIGGRRALAISGSIGAKK